MQVPKLRFRYIITAHSRKDVRLRHCQMASQLANDMVREMANVLKERRIKIEASMNALAASSYLDRAALHRAEASDRIPSLAFWLDWSDTLGVSLEKVMAEARKRVGKEAGKPPERKPLS
jgi:hypothetical protein